MQNSNIKKNIQDAIHILRMSVVSTLGPTGKTAIIDTKQGVLCVDDGATIIRQLKFKNHSKNLVLELVRQASLKTDQVVGDGTTTTILLTCMLIENSLKFLISGVQVFSLIVGLKKLTTYIIQQVRNFSIPISRQEEVESVLKTSMGNSGEELQSYVYEAIKKKGKYGSIFIEEGHSDNGTIEIRLFEGLQLDRGFVSPYFRKELDSPFVMLNNPYVLLTDMTLSSIDQIRDILELIKSNKQSLFIVAAGYEKRLLSTLIINNLNDNISVIPIKAPFFGLKQKQVLEDLALVTNSNLINSRYFSDDYLFSSKDLGRVKSIKVSNQDTNITLLKGSKVNVTRRINALRREIEVNDGVYEQDILKQRINLLSGGIVKIILSSPTEAELKHLKYKVEDGINSLETSFQEGIIISSSNLILHLLELIHNWANVNLCGEEIFSATIFHRSFMYIFQQLCVNTNNNAPILADKVLAEGYPFGVDFSTSEIRNLKKASIYDSAKMFRVVLQNSVSIASSLLLSF